MKWHSMAAFAGHVKRNDGRSLIVYVSPVDGTDEWRIMALEVDTPDFNMPPEMNATAVLDKHAHALLRPERSAAQAFKTAERYATWWQTSYATHEACPCEEIGA